MFLPSYHPEPASQYLAAPAHPLYLQAPPPDASETRLGIGLGIAVGIIVGAAAVAEYLRRRRNQRNRAEGNNRTSTISPPAISPSAICTRTRGRFESQRSDDTIHLDVINKANVPHQPTGDVRSLSWSADVSKSTDGPPATPSRSSLKDAYEPDVGASEASGIMPPSLHVTEATPTSSASSVNKVAPPPDPFWDGYPDPFAAGKPDASAEKVGCAF